MTDHAQRAVFPEHSRNTAEHPESVFPARPYVVGRRNTRGSVPGTSRSGAPSFCPACGAAAHYSDRMDRFYHLDGSDNDPCRVAILRGQPLEPLVPHALYRFWACDELLYVGITVNPATRWADHRRCKQWWEEITTITIERHSSRRRVLEAETNAIRAERPKYNVVGKPPPPPAGEQAAGTNGGGAG